MLQGELSSATSIKRSLKSEVYRLEVELEAVHKEKDLAEDKFNGQLDSVEKQYDIERELTTTLNNLLKDETSKVAALEVERDRLDDHVKRLAASQMARDIVRLEGGKEVSKCELAHKVDRLEEEKKSLEDEMGRVAREVSRLEGEKKSEVEAVSSIVTFGYYFVLGYLFIILLSHNLFALVTFVQLTAKLVAAESRIAAAESQKDELVTRNSDVGRQFRRTCGGDWPWEKVCEEGGWSEEILLVFLAYHQPILDALGLEWGMVMNGMSCFFLH